MGEWQAPDGRKVAPGNDKADDGDSFIIEATISLCALLVVGTVCVLVLRAAGVL